MKQQAAFVGDEPSSKNFAHCIPYVGTGTYAVLREWCQELELLPWFINSHTPYWLAFADRLAQQGLPIVALGKTASKRLASAGVPHFLMPHPSGRNRQMNDHAYVTEKLKQMRAYCNGGL